MATPDYLAGSILRLEPGTEYEVELTATDPDGVDSEATRLVRAKTRIEPGESKDGRVYHVYPPPSGRVPAPEGLNPPAHPKGVPFIGLYKAYYGGMWNRGDFNVVWPRKVQPGDTIVVHRGIYQANLQHYTDPHALIPDGTYWLTAHGTAEKPITIKAAGDGEVIFDGAGAAVLFNVTGTKHHIIEGLTIRHCGTAIFAGMIGSGGAEGLTMRDCRFEDVRDGIFCLSNEARDFTLYDNVFIGRNQRDVLTFWGDENDHYFKSNTAYNCRLNYKFNQASPSGLLCYHNTFIGGSPPGMGLFANAHFRNNIYLGKGRAAFPTPGNAVTSDYNGYGEHLFAITPFDASSPIIDAGVEPPKALRHDPPREKNIVFPSIEDFRANTGHEAHGRILSTDDFLSLKTIPTAIPDSPAWLNTYPADDLDFSLNPDGRAVDAGMRLPNINDDFTGKAPDLGALEVGRPPPRYGPK